jgi:hypothetical protein
MKKSTWLVLLIVLAVPSFASGPTFVEQPIPDGKAIIYIYDKVGTVPGGPGQLMVFTKNGPLAVLGHYEYYVFVTDPGNVELWCVYTRGNRGMAAQKLAVNTAEGQSSYVGYLQGPFEPDPLKVIPAEKAKAKGGGGILDCQKVE